MIAFSCIIACQKLINPFVQFESVVWFYMYTAFVNNYVYYPNLVILPVDNNEHQRIDDVSTDRISYDIRSVKTMGFAL